MIITMENDHCYNSDEEILETHHNSLLESISNLDKSQHIKKPTRTEPALQISEFNLVKSGANKCQSVKLNQLADTLNKTAKYVTINRKVKRSQKQFQTLQKPLEKPVVECIKREVGYRGVKENLRRWDPIVTSNRVAEHLSFPLKKHIPLKLNNTSSELISRFQIKSDLQKKLEELDSKPVEKIEEANEFPLSLEEIIERRKEAAKLRAQQSYQEAKARRQNKIKSKKFHRVQRKEKLKQQLKEFEQLQKTDPEAALKKLNEIEKVRAEERVTLRHRSTGQWAQNKQIRAKYDKESRQILAQQLALSRELTQKLNVEESSESDNEETKQIKPNDDNNSWLSTKPINEVQEFVSGYRKFWNEKNKNDSLKKQYDLLDVDENNKDENMKKDSDNQTCTEVTGIENDEENDEIENSEKGIIIKDNKEVCKIKNYKKESISNMLSDEDKSLDCSDDDTDLKKFKLEINGLSEKETNPKGQKKANKSEQRNHDIDENKRLRNIENGHCLNQNIITKMNPEKSKKQNLQINKLKNNISKDKKKKKVSNLSDLTDKINENGSVDTTTSTSSWVVTTIKDDEMNISSIDNIFDDLEYKINKKLENKLSNFKLDLTKASKRNKIQSTDKKKPFNEKSMHDENIQSDFKLRDKRVKPIIDDGLDETVNDVEEGIEENVIKRNTISTGVQNKSVSTTDSMKRSEDIDPSNFINVKPQQLNSAVPELMETGEDAIDDLEPDENQKMTIFEAFEDDDIVAEFQKEKQDDIDKNIPENVDLTLPGWGSWGGANIKVSQRKRKRFIIKFPKKIPRRDENKGNVIVNENKETKPKMHQVNELPFPFKSVSDFETSLRAPIGNTFVTEKSFKKLTKPRVITKMGAIIEPINDDVLINMKNKKQKVT